MTWRHKTLIKYLIFAVGMGVLWFSTNSFADEETYNECYERITKQGGSDNMVAWICGYRSGYFTDDE
jgi:hypothetical protein